MRGAAATRPSAAAPIPPKMADALSMTYRSHWQAAGPDQDGNLTLQQVKLLLTDLGTPVHEDELTELARAAATEGTSAPVVYSFDVFCDYMRSMQQWIQFCGKASDNMHTRLGLTPSPSMSPRNSPIESPVRIRPASTMAHASRASSNASAGAADDADLDRHAPSVLVPMQHSAPGWDQGSRRSASSSG